MNHNLKSYPEYFATIVGEKTHELRADADGGPFAVGDQITLQEYNPGIEAYTGRSCRVLITYISPSPKPWLVAGYTLMSIRLKRWWNV